MSRQRVALLYSYAIALIGIGFWFLSLFAAAPWVDRSGLGTTLLNGTILLVLTFMSSISPVHTRVGSMLTVSMAPLFGAVLLLPPWATASVAALGSIDLRRPGRD